MSCRYLLLQLHIFSVCVISQQIVTLSLSQCSYKEERCQWDYCVFMKTRDRTFSE